MPASTLLTVALTLSLGQVPYQSQGSYSAGAPAGAEASLPASATGGQYGHEDLYPYDAYDNWVHGHFQEIPAYRGYHFFRPYNYRNLLSQSQISGGWGNSPQLPYSHEYFWKKSHQQQQQQAQPYQGGYPAPTYQAPQPLPYAPAQPVPYGLPTTRLSPVTSAPYLNPTLQGVPAQVGPAIDPAVYQGGRDQQYRNRVRRELFEVPAQGPSLGE